MNTVLKERLKKISHHINVDLEGVGKMSGLSTYKVGGVYYFICQKEMIRALSGPEENIAEHALTLCEVNDNIRAMMAITNRRIVEQSANMYARYENLVTGMEVTLHRRYLRFHYVNNDGVVMEDDCNLQIIYSIIAIGHPDYPNREVMRYANSFDHAQDIFGYFAFDVENKKKMSDWRGGAEEYKNHHEGYSYDDLLEMHQAKPY